MLGPLVIGVALAGSFFAAWECRKPWGWGVAVGALVGMLAVTLLVPYGAFVMVAASIVVYRAASTAHIKQIASGDLDDEQEVLDVFE